MAEFDALDLVLTPVGVVRSSITSTHDAPKMETEGGVEAVIDILPQYREAMLGLKVGQQVVLLTWLHQADRSCVRVHPRGDTSRPLQGVFNTRSPARPNPVGLHVTTIVALAPDRMTVHPLEALDGTPVVDIKPHRRIPPPAAPDSESTERTGGERRDA
ncbi:tRNA (N6-threonylcarbamoyladenosine(37)-N6)-methyltransferase TrmO [Megalodesulfovibrio paquesii]